VLHYPGRNAQAAANAASSAAQRVATQAVAGAESAVEPIRMDLAAFLAKQLDGAQENASTATTMISRFVVQKLYLLCNQ
jgi:hypothetical protein